MNEFEEKDYEGARNYANAVKTNSDNIMGIFNGGPVGDVIVVKGDDDPDTQRMDNEADTNAAIDINSEALIEIVTNFTQSNQ